MIGFMYGSTRVKNRRVIVVKKSLFFSSSSVVLAILPFQPSFQTFLLLL